MAIFLDLPFWRTAIRGLGALLCNIIYNLISWIYQLFITVSRLNILSSDGVAPIYQRVTMILTIVMTFYITFEFVKYVIQPDTITDKEKGAGNILKRIIIVVVLIAFVPRLFTLAYRAQNIIIENQVISKVILGKKNVNFATFGNDFSANLLSIFYDVNESACQSGCNEEREIVNSNLDGLRKGEGLNLTQGIENSVSQSGEKIPTIRFDGILAIGVGVFILYILILYSIDVGIRYFQLLFLQIIAPIAIMGYMLPKKDNIFEKWYKQCFSTYIDLFLRLAIIYFVLMIVQVLGDAMNAGTLFAGMDDVSGSIRTFAYIVLVMGLLAFAQRAPKLLGELFPSMGSKAGIGFGLGTKDRLEPVSKAFKGAVGATGKVAGGVAGMAAGAYLGARQNSWARGTGKNRGWSAVKGAARGASAGFGKNGGLTKGIKAARESANRDRDVIEAGGNPLGASLRGGHYGNVAKDQDIEIARYEAMKTKKKGVSTAVENMKFRQQMETMGKAISAQDATAGKEWVITTKKAEKLARQYADGKIDSVDLQLGVNELIDKFNADMATRKIKASNITTGSIANQMDINSRRIETIENDTQRNNATVEWQKVQSAYTTLTMQHNNKAIDDNEYQKQVNALLNKFNADMASQNIKVSASQVIDSSDDFEIDSAKWGVVHTAIEDARTVAKELGTIEYTTVDANGNAVKQTVTYDDDTFAAKIGDYADASEAKISETKASAAYKQAHANAEASKK